MAQKPNLIDRDALCAACNNDYPDETKTKCHDCYVQSAPTVDAVPVVHGEWSSIPIGLWQCTQCAKIFDYEYNFCPHCGAKMDATDNNVGDK